MKKGKKKFWTVMTNRELTQFREDRKGDGKALWIVWGPRRLPSLFTSRQAAKKAIRASLAYAKREGIEGWSVRDYEIRRMEVVEGE